MFILTHNKHKQIIETARGHEATTTRRDSNYPTIKNFSRLTVLSCFLKAFTDEAVTTVYDSNLTAVESTENRPTDGRTDRLHPRNTSPELDTA